MSDRRRLHLSTFALGVVTLMSRVSGLAREIVVAGTFGATAVMSAFTVAYQIPNVIRLSVADLALTTALVPAFTMLMERGEEEHAWQMAMTIAWVILVVMLPLTVLGAIFAPQIISLAMPEHFAGLALATTLFRIMIPMLALMSTAGLLTGILNVYGLFTPSAMTPVAWNLVVICFVVFSAHFVDASHRIHAYAVGVLAGTVVQLLIPVLWLRSRAKSFRSRLALDDPYVKLVIRSMLPVVVSLLLLDFNLIVNSYFSARIPAALVAADTGPAVLDKAYRIFQVPQGMFAVAITTVFFPEFSRFEARADRDGFRKACLDGLRYLFVLLLPASALLIVLAHPIVKLLYEHGAWDPSQTPLVVHSLQAFAIGLAANGAILLLMRAFFSLHMPWVSAVAGVVAATTNAVLGGLLHERFGTFGIAVGTSISSVVGFAVIYVFLHRRLGGFPHAEFARVVARVIGATAVAALLAFAVVRVAHYDGTSTLASSLLVVLFGGGLGYAAYLGLAIRMKLLSRASLQVLRRRG